MTFCIKEIKAFYEKLKIASSTCGIKCDIISSKSGTSGKPAFAMSDEDSSYPISARLMWFKNTCAYILINTHTGKVGVGVPNFNVLAAKEHKFFEERLNMSMWDNIDLIRAALVDFQNKVNSIYLIE